MHSWWASACPRRRPSEATLKSLGKPAEVHVYEGAGHAFANPSGTAYRPQAASDAWQRTVTFLAKSLKPGAAA